LIGEFKFLQKAFQNNIELKEFVFNNYNTEYLELLDLLFGELYLSSCEGIEVKVCETETDAIRFQSIISELEFARYFIRKKMQVKLLPYDAFGQRKSPDMYASHNSKEYFIEVKNIQEDDLDYLLGLEIVRILNLKGFSLRVNVGFSEQISTPTFFHETREEKKKYLESALSEFEKNLENVSMVSLPFAIETTYANIELQKTEKNKSYLGTTATKDSIMFGSSEYRARIMRDVTTKAEKRNHWIGDELEKSYIVAICDDSWYFRDYPYEQVLFGPRNIYPPEIKIPEVKLNDEIKEAMENGWEPYLRETCILTNNGKVILEKDRGLFFTESVTKNISAVLVKHREKFHVLANPLAEPKINDPNILLELK